MSILEMRRSATEHLETINGVKLRFKVAGTGPICIFQTPGWGPEIGLYQGLSGFEDSFTMVYLDTRGSGGSERPDDSTFTYQNFAADVDGLRRFLGADEIFTMGHSFGGVLCLEHALRYPRSVAGMVLIDAVVAEVEEVQLDRQQRIEKMQGEAWFGDAMEAFGTVTGGHIPQSDEEFGDLARRILPLYFVDQTARLRFQGEATKAVWSHDAYRGSLNLGGRHELDDLRPRLDEIDASALIFVGSEDFICGPIQSRWLNDGLKNSMLVEIKGTGHFPWLEKPEQFFSEAKNGLMDLGIV